MCAILHNLILDAEEDKKKIMLHALAYKSTILSVLFLA